MLNKPVHAMAWKSPRPSSWIMSTLIGTLLLGMISISGCSTADKMRRQSQDYSDSVERIRERAYRCKPEELALAEVHIEFAEWEISQGDFLRAKEHLHFAKPLIDEADNKSQHSFCYGDRDGDGIPDTTDKCPDDPENINGIEDEDGCPEGDIDGDGIVDPIDQCPTEPEDFDGDEDEDGCPDIVHDKDGDGILDNDDQCPLDPEDKDGFEDIDGCPDPDNDKDGICDPYVSQRKETEKYAGRCKGIDQCINDPEDIDTFEDEDGCPDPDNDKDNILDVDDACPLVPEDYNGREDEDGCPEVSLGDGKLDIKEKVYFATNKTAVLSKSYGLLDDIAALLIKHPNVHIRVEGHTDDAGRAKANLKLSRGRAKSVRAELIKRGVDSANLTDVGYGEDRPKVEITRSIKRNKKELKAARAENRRVEFVITDQ